MYKLLILILFFSHHSMANMKIAPLRVITAEANTTQKFLVSNTGKKPIRVRISPSFIASPMAKYQTRHSSISQKMEDLTPFLRVSPPVISKLMPNERKIIRLRIADLPSNYEKGEYRTHLKFTQEVIKKVNSTENNSESISFDLTMLVNSSVPIYYQKKGRNSPPKPIIQCRKNKLKIINNSRYQQKIELLNDSIYKQLILLRQSNLDIAYNGKTTIKINDEQQKICL